MRHFAQGAYANFIEVNFVRQPEFKGILNDGYSADAVIKRMSLVNPTLRFPPGNTLLFFDEIQEFPDIATTMKFFHEDGRFDVVLSGSLLGMHYKRISSIAVLSAGANLPRKGFRCLSRLTAYIVAPRSL